MTNQHTNKHTRLQNLHTTQLYRIRTRVPMKECVRCLRVSTARPKSHRRSAPPLV